MSIEVLAQTLQSAGTRSPPFSAMRSPGTRSFTTMSPQLPSLQARARGAASACTSSDRVNRLIKLRSTVDTRKRHRQTTDLEFPDSIAGIAVGKIACPHHKVQLEDEQHEAGITPSTVVFDCQRHYSRCYLRNAFKVQQGSISRRITNNPLVIAHGQC